MKKIIHFIFLSLISILGYASDIKYPCNNIAPELLKNAKAVIRLDEKVFELISIKKSELRVKLVVTILNEQGTSSGIFNHFYSKFVSVSIQNSKLYDKNGVLIRKIGTDEIKDFSLNNSYAGYSDMRMKYISPNHHEYPFTVEYNYIVKFSGSFNFPAWYPITDNNVSLEKSSFQVIVPSEIKFRYKEINVLEPLKIKEEGAKKVYEWQANKIVATRKSFIPSYKNLPLIYAAPSNFECENYEGSLDSWKDFGLWINRLNQDRNIVSDETKRKVDQLLSGVNDTKQKVKILYEYMQNKTRYVSIQIGIGGYQTISAAEVDKYSYGDCKALSNYMKTLLDYAGIQSYYTLVFAGDDTYPMDLEFPMNKFNHAILCVVLPNDTLWLENTSQNIPFNYLGSFTDDRDVLLITENGGIPAHTKAYSASDNVISHLVKYSIKENLETVAELTNTYKSYFYDQQNYIISRSLENQKADFLQGLSHDNLEITQFIYSEDKGEIPSIQLKVKLKVSNLIKQASTNLIIPITTLQKKWQMPEVDCTNKNYFSIFRSMTFCDSMVYDIPSNYKLQNLPNEIKLEKQYGTYSFSCKVLGNKIMIVNTLLLRKGQYAYDMAKEYSEFIDNLDLSNKENLFLTKE